MASVAAEYLRRSGERAWDQRWAFKDVNGDGLITVSDASGLFAWLFTAPGDWLILILITRAPDVALFLELTPASLSGLLSCLVSLCAWGGLALFLGEVIRR